MKHFRTISEFPWYLKLPAPQHPLICVINVGALPHVDGDEPENMTLDFYSIAVLIEQGSPLWTASHSR